MKDFIKVRELSTFDSRPLPINSYIRKDQIAGISHTGVFMVSGKSLSLDPNSIHLIKKELGL